MQQKVISGTCSISVHKRSSNGNFAIMYIVFIFLNCVKFHPPLHCEQLACESKSRRGCLDDDDDDDDVGGGSVGDDDDDAAAADDDDVDDDVDIRIYCALRCAFAAHDCCEAPMICK